LFQNRRLDVNIAMYAGSQRYVGFVLAMDSDPPVTASENLFAKAA